MTFSSPTSTRRFGVWLSAGVLLGIFFTLATLAGLLYTVPRWLVVKNEPVSAEAAVVLGGGGGDRLRRAVGLYDADLVSELILVSGSRGDWEQIIRHSCPECDLTDRRATMLVGSKNTFTDAELTLKHCRKKDIRRILVVTSPYHSRRAGMTFNKIFRGSGIHITTVNSGDFDLLLTPSVHWWKDRKTLETICQEFGKILYMQIFPNPST